MKIFKILSIFAIVIAMLAITACTHKFVSMPQVGYSPITFEPLKAGKDFKVAKNVKVNSCEWNILGLGSLSAWMQGYGTFDNMVASKAMVTEMEKNLDQGDFILPLARKIELTSYVVASRFCVDAYGKLIKLNF
ncbi:MAG: hypothetical protein ABIA04_01915 [Pseudomonadota bacterium]